jgi:hypothetical protein
LEKSYGRGPNPKADISHPIEKKEGGLVEDKGDSPPLHSLNSLKKRLTTALGLSILNKIKIVSVENLNLIKGSGNNKIETTMIFENANSFPVEINQGTVKAVFRPKNNAPVPIGVIDIRHIVLNGSTERNKKGRTLLTSQVLYHNQLNRLIPLVNIAENEKTQEIRLPLSLEGSMEIKLELVPGVPVTKKVDLMLDFDPVIKRAILTRLASALNVKTTETTGN